MCLIQASPITGTLLKESKETVEFICDRNVLFCIKKSNMLASHDCLLQHLFGSQPYGWWQMTWPLGFVNLYYFLGDIVIIT